MRSDFSAKLNMPVMPCKTRVSKEMSRVTLPFIAQHALFQKLQSQTLSPLLCAKKVKLPPVTSKSRL